MAFQLCLNGRLDFQKLSHGKIKKPLQTLIQEQKNYLKKKGITFEEQPDSVWPMVRLGEICQTTSGGTPLKTKKEYYEDGNIPWLRSGEVAQGLIKGSELFITKKGLKKSFAKIFPINTVLVAMYGATAGQVGLLKFKSSTNQAICGILPNKNFIPEFLFMILKNMKSKIIRLAGGGAQPNISQKINKNLFIPLPPLEVQKEIVTLMEYTENTGKQIQKEKSLSAQLSQSLSHLEKYS